MVFNTKKQYIFAGDAYPRHYVSKLDKGDYILKLQVCCISTVTYIVYTYLTHVL